MWIDQSPWHYFLFLGERILARCYCTPEPITWVGECKPCPLRRYLPSAAVRQGARTGLMDHTHLARAPYAAGPAGSVGVSVGVASDDDGAGPLYRRRRSDLPSPPACMETDKDRSRSCDARLAGTGRRVRIAPPVSTYSNSIVCCTVWWRDRIAVVLGPGPKMFISEESQGSFDLKDRQSIGIGKVWDWNGMSTWNL
jgi:hypothetical protein